VTHDFDARIDSAGKLLTIRTDGDVVVSPEGRAVEYQIPLAPGDLAELQGAIRTHLADHPPEPGKGVEATETTILCPHCDAGLLDVTVYYRPEPGQPQPYESTELVHVIDEDGRDRLGELSGLRRQILENRCLRKVNDRRGPDAAGDRRMDEAWDRDRRAT